MVRCGQGCFVHLKVEEEKDRRDHCCAVNIVRYPCCCCWLTFVLAIVLSKGRGLSWIIAPVAYAALLAAIQWRKRSHAWERFRRKRRASRERRPSVPLAAGVLEISAPREHTTSPERGRVRIVVLHTLRGEHLVVAPEDLTIEAGDVGIATVRGVDLAAFQAMSRLRRSVGS